MLFTHYPLFFIYIEECKCETSQSIANIISKTAIKIPNNQVKFISVYTDNFSSIRAYLNWGPYNAQQ